MILCVFLYREGFGERFSLSQDAGTEKGVGNRLARVPLGRHLFLRFYDCSPS